MTERKKRNWMISEAGSRLMETDNATLMSDASQGTVRQTDDNPLGILSARQREIAERYSQGLTYKQIASELFISPATVRNHLTTIYRELQVNNKAELVRMVTAVAADEHPTDTPGKLGAEPPAHAPPQPQLEKTDLQAVEDWLAAHSMGQYAETFAANAIDTHLLPTLDDADLQAIGVNLLGHRKKLLQAIADLQADATKVEVVSRPTPVAQPERRQLTVMFCDLVGATKLASTLDPEDLASVIHSYLACCEKVVARFDGYVARYMGDGLLVYFGYPSAHEEDAERALQAGLAIIDEVGKLTVLPGIKLQVRIGVATGTVLAGETIGNDAAREHAVYGQAPNLAQRLQSLAEPDSLLIADSTRKIAGGAFVYESRGKHSLAGFSDPVEVSQVRGVKTGANRFESRSETLTPLSGRRAELHLLTDRWAQSVSGEGQVVVLSGEAGIGKSRIVHDFSATALPAAQCPPHHQCSPYQTNTLLYPFLTQLRALLMSGFNAQDDLTRLQKLIENKGGDPNLAVPLLAELLGVPDDGRYPPVHLEAEQRKRATLDVLAQLTLADAESGPLRIVVEDVHWSDPSSLELIETLVDRVGNRSALLILTARPEFSTPWLDRSHVTALALNRLNRDQALDMVAFLTSKNGLADDTREAIVHKTEGLPLFIEELTKAVVGLNPEGSGQDPRISTSPSAISVPSTLHDSLMSQLDKLGEYKRLAQAGATVGREFSGTLLAASLEVSEDALANGLERLISTGLVQRRLQTNEPVYVFKHALIRDEAYASLPRGERRRLHERIFQTLEAEHEAGGGARSSSGIRVQQDSGDAMLAVLAHHAWHAENWAEAVEYYQKAGLAAKERWAVTESISHLENALDALSQLETRKGRVLSDRAVLTRRLELTLPLCESLYFDGQFQASHDRLDAESNTIDRLSDPALRGRCRFWLARVASRLGRHHETVRAAEQAIADSLAGEDARTTGKAYSVLCVEYFFSGRSDDSTAAGRQAVRLLEPFGDSDSLGFAHHYISLAQIFAGRFSRSIEAAAAAHAIGVRLTHPRLKSYSSSVQGWALGYMGQFERGMEHLVEAIHKAPDHASSTFANGYLGCLHLENAEYDPAIERLDKAAADCRSFPSPQFASLFGAALADALRPRGKWNEALEAARVASELGSEANFPFGEAWASRVLGRLAVAQSDWEVAEQHFLQSAKTFGAAGALFEQARTFLDLADLPPSSGASAERAADYRERAQSLFQILGLSYDGNLRRPS